MKKILLFAICIVFFNHLSFAQGLKADINNYKKIPKKIANDEIYKNSLPTKWDLSKYVPSIKSQGDFQTCVGFATTYYMRTILEAIRRGITNKDSIDALSFSASYTYNAIKDSSDNNCNGGSDIGLALEFMKKNGVLKSSEQGYPFCEPNKKKPTNEDSKILDYVKLFSLIQNEDKVISTKKAISENTPVVVGIETTFTLEKLAYWSALWHKILAFFGVEDDEFSLWKPSNSDLAYGHAVCLVGYDDNKFGKGAFKVVNSYGEDWGDNGFFWIAYQDFKKYAKYGYQAYLPDKEEGQISSSGEIVFKLEPFSFDNEVPFFFNSSPKNGEEMIKYKLKNPQITGTQYKFDVKVDKLCYLYYFSGSSSTDEIVTLFPLADSLSEMLGANSVITLPLNKKINYTLGPPTGTEYNLFLFSKKALDIDSFKRRLRRSDGTFIEKIQKVCGSELIPFQNIKYDKRKMKFVLNQNHEGSIIPLLISFEQISKPSEVARGHFAR